MLKANIENTGLTHLLRTAIFRKFQYFAFVVLELLMFKLFKHQPHKVVIKYTCKNRHYCFHTLQFRVNISLFSY